MYRLLEIYVAEDLKGYFETHASEVRRDVLKMAAGSGDTELIYSTGITSLHNTQSLILRHPYILRDKSRSR